MSRRGAKAVTRAGQVRIEYMALGELERAPRNPKEHDVESLRASVGRFGYVAPLILDEGTGRLVAGHGRLETLTAAKAEGGAAPERVEVRSSDGEWMVPVVRGVAFKDSTEAEAYLIADNAITMRGAWDEAGLAAMLQGIAADRPLDGTGYQLEDMQALLRRLRPIGVDGGAQVERAEALQREWSTARGQLWAVGEHRVLCGDATDPEQVARVMDGARAHCVFTDPPYGVGYGGGRGTPRTKLAGDENTDLYGPACRMAAQFSDEAAALYLWHAGVKGIAAAAAAAAAGYEIRCELVWNKNQAQMGSLSSQYKQKHEPCYYCFRRGRAPRWFGPTNEITVWDCDRARANEWHPTQKPPELAARALRNSTEPGQLVLDLFLGSGSTLVAAEQTGRIGRGLEIDPGYVAVILERLAGMGLEPRLLEATP